MQTLRVFGQLFEAQWRVTELSRPRMIGYETTVPGGGRMEMKQSISDSAGISKVEFEIDYDLPSDLASLFDTDTDVAERRNERELEHSLHNLKDLAEAGSVR